MGRRSYHGGSTIAGRWSDAAEFPGFDREDRSEFSSMYFPTTKKQRRKFLRDQRLADSELLARSLKLDRDEALRHAGRPTLSRKPKERATQLKALVAEGFLLPTGVPNVNHPELKEWVAARQEANRKGHND